MDKVRILIKISVQSHMAVDLGDKIAVHMSMLSSKTKAK